ncbi:MAG: hypothetical protein QM677_07955 [Microbacterium sp.]
MPSPPGGAQPAPPSGVSPATAVAFATVGFFALVVAGFGLLSLLADAEVLSVPGLGQLPGVVAAAAAVTAFAIGAWLTVRAGRAVRAVRPSFGAVVAIVAASFLAYLAGLPVGAALSGVELGRALAADAEFATSWFAVVLASAALVAGWAAVALVRTRARRPRWPWERDDPSDRDEP